MSRNQPAVVATTPCSLDLCARLLSPFSLSEQFRYKRRVYAQNLIDDKQFAKLHTKVKQSLEGTFHDHCPSIQVWPSLLSQKWVSGPGPGLGSGSMPRTGLVMGSH